MDNNYYENVNNYGTPGPQPSQPSQPPQREHRGLAIASLVIGILSMTLLCFCGSIVGIVGLVLGIVALCKKQKPMGLSIAGIVTSSIGILCGILLLAFIAGAGGFAEKLHKAMYKDKHSTVPVPYDTETQIPEDTQVPEADGTSAAQLFEGKSFTCGDSTTIYFDEDMNYIWYRDDDDHSDNYYGGSYTYYTGAEAMDYLVNDLAEYGASEDRINEYFDRNEGNDFYNLENMCVISMTIDEMVYEGETTYPAKQAYYMGFYKDGVYEGVHMDTFNRVLFQEN